MNNKWTADDICNNSFINDALMKNKWPSSFPSVIACFEGSLNNLVQNQIWPLFMLFYNIFNGLGHSFEKQKQSLAKSTGGRG